MVPGRLLMSHCKYGVVRMSRTKIDVMARLEWPRVSRIDHYDGCFKVQESRALFFFARRAWS